MTNAIWTSGRVVLGCGTFGGIGGATDLIGRGLDQSASLTTLDEAAALGITMLDTAERYAGGASEILIGQWLSEREASVTAPIRITTKVAPAQASGRDAAFDAAFIEPIFAQSLKRLGVDHVEWFLTHGPDDETPIETTLEALEAIRASGRCRHVGGCNLDASQLSEALNAAERLGIVGYELVQNGYSLLQPDAEAEVRRLCGERGLASVAFSPLAGGVLTGKYRRGEPPAAGTRLNLRPEGFDEMMTPLVHDAIEALAVAADGLGVPPGALALAWLTHRDDVTALITGPSRSVPHIGLAAQAIDLHVPDDLIDELAERFRTAALS
jgi:aryl-alcohol dehydrogenase-like predicted oxidoreductase